MHQDISRRGGVCHSRSVTLGNSSRKVTDGHVRKYVGSPLHFRDCHFFTEESTDASKRAQAG